MTLTRRVRPQPDRPARRRLAGHAQPSRLLPVLVAAACVLPTGHAPDHPARIAARPAVAVSTATTVEGVRLNSYEAGLLRDLNAARTARGLHALTLLPRVTNVARRWSWHLADTMSLAHNPSLESDVEHAGCAAWTTLAENTGYSSSSDPGTQFQAYMDSPVHRANILDPSVRYVGIGGVERSGRTYDTMDFVNGCSTSSAPPRTPAQGIYRDRFAVTATTTVAAFESGSDQRLSASASGGSRAGTPTVDSPTAGDDAARLHVWRASTAPGSSRLILSVALDLSSARTVSLRLAAHDPTGRPVAVDVRFCRTFGTSVHVGWAHPGAAASWWTFTLPSAARAFRNRIELVVPGSTLDSLSGSLSGRTAHLAVFAIRVGA